MAPEGGGSGQSSGGDKPPGRFTNHEVKTAEEAKQVVGNLLEHGFAVQVTGYKYIEES